MGLKTILGLEINYPEIVEKPQGVTIGHDVWIGQGVRLIPGIRISDGAVVAARAVVTKDLEPYGIYGGIPARLIKKRFSDSVIAALREIACWNWQLEKIMRNLSFFNLKLTEIDDVNHIYAAVLD